MANKSAPPPSVSTIKDKRGEASFDRWLYNFWVQSNVIQSYLTGGSPGQVLGVNASGNIAMLTIDGGDDFAFTISGNTLTLSLSEAAMQQWQDMANGVEELVLLNKQLRTAFLLLLSLTDPKTGYEEKDLGG